MIRQPLVCQDFHIFEAAPSHSDTPHSVELLWASDRHRPLSDNTQHSQETDMNVPDGIRSRNPSKRAAVDRHLRPRPLRSVTLSHYVIVIILSLTNVVLYEYC